MESSTKGQIIAILYNKEEIQKFLKPISLSFSHENFFLNSERITFIDNGLRSIIVRKQNGKEIEINILAHSNLWNYILSYDFERKIPNWVFINDKNFTKLQEDFLKSDAYHGELSNSIEIDNAFIYYYAYEDVHFKLDEDLSYITFTDGWAPKILVPYDCDLFWWLYKKLFKGEN